MCPAVKDASSDLDGFCEYFKTKLKQNREFIQKNVAAKATRSSYWHMVDLVYKQMDGIVEGFIANTLDNNEIIDTTEFDTEYGIQMINFIPDVWDYVTKFGEEKSRKSKKAAKRPSCSVLIKHLPQLRDLYVGHNTWHEYSAMGYRFLKKYKFNYHLLEESDEVIPGHTMTMSSYAGTVMSLDDFLSLSSGLMTTETSLNLYNQDLYTKLESASQLFEPVRVLVANRLSRTGKQWTHLMSKFNGGTYNNQWMIVDYNKLGEDGSMEDGLLWVYEQLPGRTWSSDQTDLLRTQGYWISYNRPFYPEAYNMSGGRDMTEKHGDYFSYIQTSRAKVNTINTESFKFILLDYEKRADQSCG